MPATNGVSAVNGHSVNSAFRGVYTRTTQTRTISRSVSPCPRPISPAVCVLPRPVSPRSSRLSPLNVNMNNNTFTNISATVKYTRRSRSEVRATSPCQYPAHISRTILRTPSPDRKPPSSAACSVMVIHGPGGMKYQANSDNLPVEGVSRKSTRYVHVSRTPSPCKYRQASPSPQRRITVLKSPVAVAPSLGSETQGSAFTRVSRNTTRVTRTVVSRSPSPCVRPASPAIHITAPSGGSSILKAYGEGSVKTSNVSSTRSLRSPSPFRGCRSPSPCRVMSVKSPVNGVIASSVVDVPAVGTYACPDVNLVASQNTLNTGVTTKTTRITRRVVRSVSPCTRPTSQSVSASGPIVGSENVAAGRLTVKTTTTTRVVRSRSRSPCNRTASPIINVVPPVTNTPMNAVANSNSTVATRTTRMSHTVVRSRSVSPCPQSPSPFIGKGDEHWVRSTRSPINGVLASQVVRTPSPSPCKVRPAASNTAVAPSVSSKASSTLAVSSRTTRSRSPSPCHMVSVRSPVNGVISSSVVEVPALSGNNTANILSPGVTTKTTRITRRVVRSVSPSPRPVQTMANHVPCLNTNNSNSSVIQGIATRTTRMSRTTVRSTSSRPASPSPSRGWSTSDGQISSHATIRVSRKVERSPSPLNHPRAPAPSPTRARAIKPTPTPRDLSPTKLGSSRVSLKAQGASTTINAIKYNSSKRPVSPLVCWKYTGTAYAVNAIITLSPY